MRRPFVIVDSSTKGGVGKTTISSFLALAFKKAGKKTLLVDFDGSLDATDFFLRHMEMDEIEAKGVYLYLTRKIRDLSSCILPSPLGVDVIPSHPDMEDLGASLLQDGMAFQRFENALRQLDYDVIVIDCPGDLSLNTRLGIFSADRVLIPCSDGRWEVRGAARVVGKIQEVEEQKGLSVVYGAVLSKVSQKMGEQLKAEFPLPVANTVITTNGVFKLASGDARKLGDGSTADAQFLALANEIINDANNA